MSVIITLKFPGDVARFRQALTEHGDQFAKLAAANAKGAAAYGGHGAT